MIFFKLVEIGRVLRRLVGLGQAAVLAAAWASCPGLPLFNEAETAGTSAAATGGGLPRPCPISSRTRADLAAKNEAGQTPLDVARDNRPHGPFRKTVLELLEKASSC